MEIVKKLIGETLYNKSFTADNGIWFETGTNDIAEYRVIDKIFIDKIVPAIVQEPVTKFLIIRGDFYNKEYHTPEFAKESIKEYWEPFFVEFDELYNSTDWQLGKILSKSIALIGRKNDVLSGEMYRAIKKYFGIKYIDDDLADWDKFQEFADLVK